MPGHSKARDDKRKKRIRQRRNAETAQAGRMKVSSGSSLPTQTPPSTTT